MSQKRLGGLDAAFLAAESATSHMHMMAVMVLDPAGISGGYRFETVRDFIAARLHLIPPLRRRLLEVPFGIARPVWIEDPQLDLDHHIRRAAVPSPGGPREVAAMAAEINSRQLDRTRPLWEMVIVEGLLHGRIAVIAKVHHALMDGVAGMQFMASLVSPRPDASAPPRPPDEAPPRIPSGLELLARALPGVAARPFRVARMAGGALQAALARALGPRGEPLPEPAPVPRCALNARLSPERSAAYVCLELERVKAVGHAFGATVNEVVLAVVSGALRRHLQARGELIDEPLVASVPASTHEAGGDDLSNAYVVLFTSLATHLADPEERLRAICESSRNEKRRDRAFFGEALSELTEIPSPLFLTLVARAFTDLGIIDRVAPFCNLVVSNVPGPPVPIYFGGALIEDVYALGPLFDGVVLNITVLSISGRLDFGLSACRRALPDLWQLAELLPDALDELVARIPGHAGSETRSARA